MENKRRCKQLVEITEEGGGIKQSKNQVMRRTLSLILLVATLVGILPIGVSNIEAGGADYYPLPKVKKIEVSNHIQLVTLEDGRLLGGESTQTTGSYTSFYSIVGQHIKLKELPLTGVVKTVVRGYYTGDGVKNTQNATGQLFVLQENGNVYFKGVNEYGQGGFGNQTPHRDWNKIPIEDVVDIYGVGSTMFFIKKDNTTWATGYNRGNLGTGDSVDKLAPAKVDLMDIKEIVAAGAVAFFTVSNGDVYASGINSSGQLGLEDKLTRTTPTKVDITNIKKVVTNGLTTLFIQDNGNTFGVGVNSNGQLGTGDTTSRELPVQLTVSNVEDAIIIGNSVFLLDKNGDIYAAGQNTGGSLGLGHNTSRVTEYTKVPIDGEVSKIETSNGGNALVIYTKDGSAYTYDTLFGGNAYKFLKLNVGDVKEVSVTVRRTANSSPFTNTDFKAVIVITNEGRIFSAYDEKNPTTATLQNSEWKDVTSQFYQGTDNSFISIPKLNNIKKYGSWGASIFGVDSYTDNTLRLDATKGNSVDLLAREVYGFPDGTLITIDNAGQMKHHKTVIATPTLLTFDANRIDKIELGHIQTIGLVPLVYTKDDFIYYMDTKDFQFRILPIFQDEIRGTMIYHGIGNASTHYLFIKNDGTLSYLDKNRVEQPVHVNLNDVIQVIPATMARPDYFQMNDGTLKTLTGNVTMPGGQKVVRVLSNRFVELTDGFIYTMQGTALTKTTIMGSTVKDAVNDLISLSSNTIMKADTTGKLTTVDTVNSRLIKSIVKIDEDNTFIVLIDDSTATFGYFGFSDLMTKGLTHADIKGVMSNGVQSGTLRNVHLVTKEGYLYTQQGARREDFKLDKNVVIEMMDESGFTFDPSANVGELITLIEQKIKDMVSLDEVDEIQTLINRIPFSHQTDKDRLQQMLLDKIAELMKGNKDSTAPVLTVTNNPTEWVNQGVTLNIVSKDEDGGSGVKDITLPDNKVYVGHTTTFFVTANGEYTFKTTDNEGNESTLTVTVSKIDNDKPNLTIKIG